MTFVARAGRVKSFLRSAHVIRGSWRSHRSGAGDDGTNSAGSGRTRVRTATDRTEARLQGRQGNAMARKALTLCTGSDARPMRLSRMQMRCAMRCHAPRRDRARDWHVT